MPVNSALPGLEHVVVVVLFGLDAALVLKLSKLGGALLVHNLLQVAAHGAVALANLPQDVGLVTLLSNAGLDHLVLEGVVLTLDLALHVLALVILHPLVLLLLLLVLVHRLLAGRKHVLQQVGAGLVLAVPLLLAHVPLLRVLLGNEVVNHRCVCQLIGTGLASELLKLHGLSSVLVVRVLLDLFDSGLAGETLVQQLEVALLLGELSLVVKLLFLLVVGNEVLVALQVQNVLFIFVLLLASLLDSPLLGEHGALLHGAVGVLLLLDHVGLLLPVEHGEGVLDEDLLLLGLLDLAFELLLGVELVQLGVHLLLHHLLLELSALVNELLLALNPGAVGVELSVFIAEDGVLHLEFLVHASLHLSLTLTLALLLKG